MSGAVRSDFRTLEIDSWLASLHGGQRVTTYDTGTQGSPRFVGIIGSLTQLSFTVQRLLEGVAAEHGLSLIQARLLVTLLDRRPTMTQLAGLLYLEKSSMTGLASRAEAHGLVRRHREGAVIHAMLTDDGRLIAEDIASSVNERLAMRSTALSLDECEQLIQMADRLINQR
jgi:DNA-binding MarR family transcriptional regulator